jgi:hypothetical protein
MADDVSNRTIDDPTAFSPHAIVTSFAAAVNLALLATWTGGSIAPRIVPTLLLTTLFSYCTMILGAIVAQLYRKQRLVGVNLALALALAVLIVTVITLLAITQPSTAARDLSVRLTIDDYSNAKSPASTSPIPLNSYLTCRHP